MNEHFLCNINGENAERFMLNIKNNVLSGKWGGKEWS